MRATPITVASQITGWEPSIDAYEPSLVEARDAAASFVADMERGAEPYWLVFMGVNGCGKTLLMRQVWEQAKRINPGNPKNNPIWPPNFETSGEKTHEASRPYALWYEEGGIASRMRNGDFELPRSLRGDFFVAVDEIGISRDPTNFVSEALGTLCESRVGRWSAFASNFNLKEIGDRMDYRISSRMIRHGNRLVTIKATDYALRPKA
jgi:hypothetical protein